jgi:uncharacterized protein YndB with AHSA1/START domain/predicted enzyme related to lactoylglutathione lyase
MSKVVHFEIPAENPERAVKFYEEVFGWEISNWGGPFDYWLVTAGDDDEPGINGAIMPQEFGAVVRDTISVDSFDEFAQKIEESGGKMLTEKMEIPGMGFTGQFQDTEGNIMGIIEITMIYITRTFNAPPEEVWKAWTDPESVKYWWGPKEFTAPYAKIDLKVGGTYLYAMRSPEGEDFWSTGVYQEIVPQERIVSTDSFADADGNVVPASHYSMKGEWPLELMVTVTFHKEDGKTRLTLQHQGFPDHENRDLAESGWKESLDKLASVLKGKK